MQIILITIMAIMCFTGAMYLIFQDINPDDPLVEFKLMTNLNLEKIIKIRALLLSASLFAIWAAFMLTII